MNCMAGVSLPGDQDRLVEEAEIAFKCKSMISNVEGYMIYKKLSNETGYASVPAATSHLAYRK